MGTISLKNVRKEFGDVVIIPGADLEIEKGELSCSLVHRVAASRHCCG